MTRLIPLILICACSQSRIIDSRLDVYVQSFEYEASKRGYNIDLSNHNIIVTDVKNCGGGNHKSGCARRSFNLVEIDVDLLESSSYEYVELIFFHEIGHLVLGRGHSWSTASIMHDVPDIEVWKDHREFMIDELFNEL